MKKIILFSALCIFVVQGFAQTTSKAVTKEYYLKKSRTQKTIAWVMVGTGVAVAVAGYAILAKKIDDEPLGYFTDENYGDKEVAFIVAGGVVAVGSIPLFIISSKNKKRAAGISFIQQPVFVPVQNSFAYKHQPGISIKIKL